MAQVVVSSVDASFPYQPLKRDEIRLVTLLPDSKEDQITCSLESLSLTDFSSEYRDWLADSHKQLYHRDQLREWKRYARKRTTAGIDAYSIDEDLDISLTDYRHAWGDYLSLSYTWGSKETSKHIILNDQRFPVTENLYTALESIRNIPQASTGGQLKVWCDAICINQNDPAERGREVSRMRSIYVGALAVLVSLGDPPEDCNAAFQFIRAEIHNIKQQTLSQQASEDQSTRSSLEQLVRVTDRLFSHPYWSRVWVIQELTVASGTVVIAYGNIRIPLEHVLDCWKYMFNELFEIVIDGKLNIALSSYAITMSNILLGRLDFTRSVSRQIELNQHVTPLDLAVGILVLGLVGHSTEPHDQIYSLLGLLPRDLAAEISVDYSKSGQEVFIDFARAFIKTTGLLDYIFLRSQNQTTKPSWVPNWVTGLDRIYVFHLSLLDLGTRPEVDPRTIIQKASIQYSKPMRADLNRQGSVAISHDDTYLNCEGFLLGKISGHSAETFSMSGKPISSQGQLEVQPTSSANPYGSGRSLLVAFIAASGMIPSKSLEKVVDSLMRIPWTGSKASVAAEMLPQADWLPEARKVYQKLKDTCSWNRLTWSEYLIFERHRHLLGTFHIGGKPFQDYFPVAGDELNMTAADEPPSTMVAMSSTLNARRIAQIASGHFAAVPAIAQMDDEIWVLLGATMPAVLRRTVNIISGQDTVEVIGEAFVEGFMEGEGIMALDRGEYVLEQLQIS